MGEIGHRATLTPTEFAEQLGRIAISSRGDPEVAHSIADELMCELLKDLGYSDGVRIFRDMDKWYA